MSISAYDLWKTSPPISPPAQGDCLEWGRETQWITGRALVMEKTARPCSVPGVRSADIDLDELYCAQCGSEAIRARFDPCICGADTAWRCVCP